MKNRKTITQIILIICFLIGTYGLDNIIPGKHATDADISRFVILTIPALIGYLLYWISFPLIFITYFIIKGWKQSELNYKALVLSFLYLVGIHFYQKETKNRFSDNFISYQKNLIFYKNNYKKYEFDILPFYLDSTLKSIKELEKNKPKAELVKISNEQNVVGDTSTASTISSKSIIPDKRDKINFDNIDEAFALKVTKAKFGFDTTKSIISDMNNLTFSTSILAFKIKCVLGIEKSCLCQSTKEEEVIYYYGYPTVLNFITIYDVYFALSYFLTMLGGITLFGINIHLLTKRNADKANS